MRRRGLRLVLGVATLAMLGFLVVWLLLRASLPQLEGARSLPGLSDDVLVERDARGAPSIQARTLADADRALGFLHAQDRFFQMDLLRRSAAGELAELFGSRALELDRKRRRLRFRTCAERAFASESPDLRARVQAYSEGVNAGLAALRARPFEYWILRQAPRPWSVQDSYLVLFAMFLDLQSEDNELDLLRGKVTAELPELAAFLFPGSTPWDAPLVGTPADWPKAPQLSRQPGEFAPTEESAAAGSNAFALGGQRSLGGAAMLASDMHLGLRLPNIWYRVRMRWESATRSWDAAGLSLPGAPGLVAGSNGVLAWSFTNSYADAVDWVELDEREALVRQPEILQVAGAPAETLFVDASRFGPVSSGAPRRALAWVALRPDGANLRLLELMHTAELESALTILPRCGIPAQNVVLAAADGRIAWTIAGRLPLRRDCDGRTPWSSQRADWLGLVEPDSIPRLIRGADAELWSANARPWIGARGERLGDAGFALGARAAQIRDGLRALHAAQPSDLLSIQLDDRALFLSPWRELFLSTLAMSPAEKYASLREHVEAWSGRASIESVGYRIVRNFRLRVRTRLLGAWLAPLAGEVELSQLPIQVEAAVYVALRDRPPELLPAGVVDWDSFLREELDGLAAQIGADLDAYTWGRQNRLRMAHPLAASLGPFGRWLRLPAVEMPGDSYMPRVQGPDFGAPARFVVAPGREAQGLMHAAGGISGHPLSPYFAAGHDAWLRGEPTAFWPGPPQHRLQLLASAR